MSSYLQEAPFSHIQLIELGFHQTYDPVEESYLYIRDGLEILFWPGSGIYRILDGEVLYNGFISNIFFIKLLFHENGYDLAIVGEAVSDSIIQN